MMQMVHQNKVKFYPPLLPALACLHFGYPKLTTYYLLTYYVLTYYVLTHYVLLSIYIYIYIYICTKLLLLLFLLYFISCYTKFEKCIYNKVPLLNMNTNGYGHLDLEAIMKSQRKPQVSALCCIFLTFSQVLFRMQPGHSRGLKNCHPKTKQRYLTCRNAFHQ